MNLIINHSYNNIYIAILYLLVIYIYSAIVVYWTEIFSSKEIGPGEKFLTINMYLFILILALIIFFKNSSKELNNYLFINLIIVFFASLRWFPKYFSQIHLLLNIMYILYINSIIALFYLK